MASKGTKSAKDETGVAETATRVCPSCEEARSASAFRSAHPATHCDVCHEAKRAAKEAPEPDDSIEAAVERVVDGDPEPPHVRRLRHACPDAPTTCPVLGLDLDPSPRAPAGHRPVQHAGTWMSARAAALVAFGGDPDDFELVADWLRTQARES